MSVRFQGNQLLFDEYGNQIDVKVQSIQGSDKGFTKVWLTDFMAKLDLIGNQKLKVAFWLIDHVDRNTNYINYTQREIAKQSGICLDTVSKTMKALKEADFIRQVHKVYMINPEVLYKGYSANARQGILTEYITGEDQRELTPEEQVKNISRAIAILQKQRQNIEKQAKEIQEKEMEKYVEMESIMQQETSPETSQD